jgi:superfamily II DNA or RNA helicase
MCIQDWLRGLAHGQTILVLVPTVNYQQQWLRELCHQHVGLRLPPHRVFTGTPTGLEAARRRINFEPCVLVLTYAALAQIGSGTGKGGFDVNSIEIFLQDSNVQYVILDEVHKVAEDLHSVSSHVTRALVDWLRDGSLRGLIGFSGTAAAFRPRFAQLGLQLVYVLPAGELIAYGYVAPFAELGVPFAFSEREQSFRDLVARYYVTLHEYVDALGGRALRRLFAEIPREQKMTLGRDLFHMYLGREDQEQALTQRFTAWEQGDRLRTSELALVSMVQITHGWSDETLASNVGGVTADQFDSFRQRLDELRTAMLGHVYLADTRRHLARGGFGVTFDAAELRALPTAPLSSAARLSQLRHGLAASFVGLLSTLTEVYRRTGEGRVAAIKAILEAERAVRRVPRAIIFDAGRRIDWRAEPAIPGYAGVAGLFAEMLGDERFTPMAVLSGEIYLPRVEDAPLTGVIAEFIRQDIMLGELSEILLELGTVGLDLPTDTLDSVRRSLGDTLARFLSTVTSRSGQQPAFNRTVLSPLRASIRRSALAVDQARRAAARLNLRQYYVRNWLRTFLDYADIAGRFEHAVTARLEQVGGRQRAFEVVRMPEGERKQMMYDLTARIVDAERLPIDMVIVSTWARTGWNVVAPNVLIDATATRDPVAWQQLRGRAMRAQRSWSNACYQLTLMLLGSSSLGIEDLDDLPEDVAETLAALTAGQVHERSLSETDRELLHAAHQMVRKDADERLLSIIEHGSLEDLSRDERERLAVGLLLARNKVTHIYELVKASGSTRQIRFDRESRRWTRSIAVAMKHGAEYAVSPLDGSYGAGPRHAPLVYANDPRRDPPSMLRQRLENVLAAADERIVAAWLRAILHHPETHVDAEAVVSPSPP